MIYLALVWVAAIPSTETSNIGWSTAQVWSPDHRYVVVNIVTDKGTDTRIGQNELWLIDVKEGVATKCFSYNRNVDVLWSPDSLRFVLNDRAESNEAGCILKTPALKDGKLSIQDTPVSKTLIDTDEMHDLRRMGHRYVVAKKWIDNDTLELDSSGYDPVDEKGPSDVEFVHNYNVVKGTFEKVESVDNEQKNTDFKTTTRNKQSVEK